jgi:uncharacterized protein
MPALPLPVVDLDLSDAEFAEVDEPLAATPEPLLPLDALMLDGFLCGGLVQPAVIAPEAWLPWVFDAEGRALPVGADRCTHERARALARRLHSALNRALVDDEGLDPLILENVDDEVGAEQEAPAATDPLAGLSPFSRPLMPWVACFHSACVAFPALLRTSDPTVVSALAHRFRRLHAESDEERDLDTEVNRELPLAALQIGVCKLEATVADLANLTRGARYRFDTVRCGAPKPGRNDRFPCSSGRKSKHCNGR